LTLKQQDFIADDNCEKIKLEKNKKCLMNCVLGYFLYRFEY